MEYNYEEGGSAHSLQPAGSVENLLPDETPTSDEYYVDWGADVPVVRHGTPCDHRSGGVGGVPNWRPISSEFWQQAVCMRPDLRVQVRLKFLYPRASSELCVFAVPPVPAPVTSMVCIFGSGDQTATYRLFDRCANSISLYASTLTDIVLLTEVGFENRPARIFLHPFFSSLILRQLRPKTRNGNRLNVSMAVSSVSVTQDAQNADKSPRQRTLSLNSWTTNFCGFWQPVRTCRPSVSVGGC